MERVGLFFLCLCLILNCFQSASVCAERAPEFEYDIFTLNDTLALWLDVTPVLTQTKMEDLISGLDIFINVNIKVEQPRSLFFPRKISEVEASLAITHPLTEDIYDLKLSNFGLSDYEFKDQICLSDFMADSLIFKIAAAEDIKRTDRIRLRLEISCKSFTSSILPIKSPESKKGAALADTSGTELFLDIFTMFFNFIGYGEDKYKVSSPAFKLEELSVFDR